MSYWDGTHWVREDAALGPEARPSRRRHALEVLAEGTLIALLTVGLIAGTAFAGKGGTPGPNASTSQGGGKSSGGSISLLVLDGGDGVPNYMERVGFDVSTSATDRPFVGLRCYQGSEFVLDGYAGYFEGTLNDPWVTLGSPYWAPEQSADCTARLFHYDKHGRQNVLATLDFVAQP